MLNKKYKIGKLNNLDNIFRTLNGNKKPFKGKDEKELSEAGQYGYERLRELLQTLTDWNVIQNCNWSDSLDKIVSQILYLGY